MLLRVILFFSFLLYSSLSFAQIDRDDSSYTLPELDSIHWTQFVSGSIAIDSVRTTIKLASNYPLLNASDWDLGSTKEIMDSCLIKANDSSHSHQLVIDCSSDYFKRKLSPEINKSQLDNIIFSDPDSKHGHGIEPVDVSEITRSAGLWQSPFLSTNNDNNNDTFMVKAILRKMAHSPKYKDYVKTEQNYYDWEEACFSHNKTAATYYDSEWKKKFRMWVLTKLLA